MFEINSKNRHAARRLLTANGHPSADVREYSVAQLAEGVEELYIKNRMTEDAIRAALAGGGPEAAYGMPKPEPKPAPAADDAAATLAASIRAIAGSAVDESRVIELIREHAPAAAAPAVIEIKTGDAVRKVEGRTHAAFESVLKAASCVTGGTRLNVMLVGPAGSGKTTLAEQAADALGLAFYSTGAVGSKYDLIGFVRPDGEVVRTPFRDAFENGGLFLWDELDGSDPRAIVAFNQALSNGSYAFPDGMVKRHPDFVALAACNTWGQGATAEYVGRAKLDAASLNRFVRFEVGYDAELESALVDNADWCAFVQGVRKAADEFGVKAIISPRQTIQGAALLAAGLKRKDVEAATLFAGMDDATASKLKRRAGELVREAA